MKEFAGHKGQSLNLFHKKGTHLPIELMHQLSRVMRKPTFCICENKDADQLRGNREADQRLCFRYLDSTNTSSF